MGEAIKLTIPGAAEQRQIIEGLESEEESVFVYAVTKNWYHAWKDYVGLGELSNKDGRKHQPPDSLDMDILSDDNNMYVDEKIWIRWVQWYGVSDSHQLDRRSSVSNEKEFEVCVLSPYSGILENPRKTFDLSEETGYVELQLRKVFSVVSHRTTRLWVCEKTRHARFVQLLDRTIELCNQDVLEHKKEYILALEVAELDGRWPSHNPGMPIGSFKRYHHLIGRAKEGQYWERELSNTLESVFTEITCELKDTVSGIVNTTKCMTVQKENDLGQVKERLEMRVRSVEEVQKSLNKKAKEIIQEEEMMKAEVRRMKRDRDHLEQERQKFQDELKHIQELNKIQESKVCLNIGGHTYMTSLMTLVKDGESMLAAMFSGRHALAQEEDGSYFIDRDGTHFRFILNFLRDGGFREGTLPKDKGFLNELLTEAEYYQINTLVKLLSDMLKASGNGDESDTEICNSPKMAQRHVSARRPHRKIALINNK